MESRGYETFSVIKNEIVAENICRMDVEAEVAAEPGQFFMVRGWEGGPFFQAFEYLRRFVGRLTFLYAVVGEGTAILSRKSGRQGSC